jgi:hypothetical protein
LTLLDYGRRALLLGLLLIADMNDDPIDALEIAALEAAWETRQKGDVMPMWLFFKRGHRAMYVMAHTAFAS